MRIYHLTYGWMQDDHIYERIIGWRTPPARYVGKLLLPENFYRGDPFGRDMGLGWKPSANGLKVQNSSFPTFGPVIYNEWCNCIVSAIEVVMWDPTHQRQSYRDRAMDAIFNYMSEIKGEAGNGRPDPWEIIKSSNELLLRMALHVPDAVSFAGNVDSAVLFGGSVSKGTIVMLTGKDRGKSANMVDGGLGIGIDGGAGGLVTEYYYLDLTGSKRNHVLEDFKGVRVSLNLDVNFGVFSLGQGISIAPVNGWEGGVYIISRTYSYGLGFEGVPINGNLNYGKTEFK